jgi:AcrR family transcriptional regulator
VSEARREQAVAEARALLEEHGPGALTMRRLGERLGIRAPSLYKHFPSKAALEAALMAEGLREMASALEEAPPGIAGLARAYRTWALAHPHLYTLTTGQPLPRDELPAGVEERAAAPLLAALDDEHRARAAWAAAHGLASLELAGRFPPGVDLDAAWGAMATAFGRRGSQPGHG